VKPLVQATLNWAHRPRNGYVFTKKPDGAVTRPLTLLRRSEEKY
jgi:hypothetical protein